MKDNIYNKARKNMKSYWNKCFTSTKVLLLMLLVISSTMLLATIYNANAMDIVPPEEEIPQEVEGVWIPTADDIEYQDSMWQIINRTQKDVDIIKEDIEDILYKLDRIEYSDGTWDSIRIPIESDEERMWIGGNGDTIWE